MDSLHEFLSSRSDACTMDSYNMKNIRLFGSTSREILCLSHMMIREIGMKGIAVPICLLEIEGTGAPGEIVGFSSFFIIRMMMVIIIVIDFKYFNTYIILLSTMLSYFAFFFLIALVNSGAPGCQHPIFCNQKILTAVAESNLYPDSKTFVDLVLKVSVEQALKQFETKPLYTFLQNCFTTNNTILVPVNLTDWKQYPESLLPIKSSQLKQFALDLNRRWNQLARAVDLNYKTDCLVNCSSFIPELNGRIIVIPGGRFVESYYWDTYWILKGFIVSRMFNTAVHLIENFVILIKKYGFIPNGFRHYYLNRSQPPFFALMVKQLVSALRKYGQSYAAQVLQQVSYPTLISQHNFFMQSHSKPYKLKSGKSIVLNFYNANTTTPRPQSYRQDYRLVQNIKDQQIKKNVLKGISSMAQSGWDFSSRWLTQGDKLESNVILSMIPSDLNTLMGIAEQELAYLSNKFNRPDLVKHYQQLLTDRRSYFSQILTNQHFPDRINSSARPNSYPSDLYPYLLFPTRLNTSSYQDVVNPVTSSINTWLQWDKPNVWAPNNWILHEVLGPTNEKIKIAQQWVSTVYCSWKKQKVIYQKYRNDKIGQRGQGGEYLVQTGFGWSNGLALYYLELYATQLVVPECP